MKSLFFDLKASDTLFFTFFYQKLNCRTTCSGWGGRPQLIFTRGPKCKISQDWKILERRIEEKLTAVDIEIWGFCNC
jgi:hypothetical protein